MKSKIVILGVCVLLSACGRGGRGNASSRQQEGGLSATHLNNLEPQAYVKLQQNKSGNAYYHLGSFPITSLPVAVGTLPSESEVGTLSVEFEDEVYSKRYEGEVRPVFKKRQVELKTTVYLLKEKSTDQFTFAFKDDETAKLLRLKEEVVTVQSNPGEYCSYAHFYMKQVYDGVSVGDSMIPCLPSGICQIFLHNDLTGGNTAYPFNVNAPQFPIGVQCLETQVAYRTQENKKNRSVPKKGTVLMGLKQITFDL